PGRGILWRPLRRVNLRADWNEVRVEVMRGVLSAKFSDPDLRARLIATGRRELVEENTWNDRFWGRSRRAGQNMLGRLLMELRDSCAQSDLNFYLGAHQPHWLEQAPFPCCRVGAATTTFAASSSTSAPALTSSRSRWSA